jgi:hypothetical protein
MCLGQRRRHGSILPDRKNQWFLTDPLSETSDFIWENKYFSPGFKSFGE